MKVIPETCRVMHTKCDIYVFLDIILKICLHNFIYLLGIWTWIWIRIVQFFPSFAFINMIMIYTVNRTCKKIKIINSTTKQSDLIDRYKYGYLPWFSLAYIYISALFLTFMKCIVYSKVKCIYWKLFLKKYLS